MKKWTEEELKAAGYEIKNAKITSVDLSMADHGVLDLQIGLDGDRWCCVYGGFVLGKGYLGSPEVLFEGSSAGLEYIMRVMDVVGVSKLNDMKNQYVRVATKGWGDCVKIIGNILKDHWFDSESFFHDPVVTITKHDGTVHKHVGG